MISPLTVKMVRSQMLETRSAKRSSFYAAQNRRME